MKPMKIVSSLVVTVLALAALFLAVPPEAPALPKGITYETKTDRSPDAQVPGWFINLGITGARAKITEAEPKALQVVFIFKGTPAAGQLEIGDRIVGVNGKKFTAHKFGLSMDKPGYDGPMKEFGNALEDSQSKDGKLVLDVERGGKKVTVELKLTTRYGAFSKTYPYNCKKSDLIYRELCEHLVNAVKQGGDFNAHGIFFAEMALLSGDKKYLPVVKHLLMEDVKGMRNDYGDGKTMKYEGLLVWWFTFRGIGLAEYYLQTGEKWVKPELEIINRWLEKAQIPNGGFGHNAWNAGGNTNGYGGMCITTSQALMAWSLMERCGIAVDQKRVRAAHDFIAKGTNRIGSVWYADADASRDSGWGAPGATGASALAHYLSPVSGYRQWGLRNARCIGAHPTAFTDSHDSPVLGMTWGALGAGVDPGSLRRLLDEYRWYFALSHCPEGNFYFQPNRDGFPFDYMRTPRLLPTAATALILALKEKKLLMTGAKLSPREIPDRVQRLLTTLKKDKSTQARITAAAEIAKFAKLKPDEVKPAAGILVEALKDDEVKVRKSVLAALTDAKGDADDLVPGLIDLLKSSREDTAVRIAAVNLLGSYGPDDVEPAVGILVGALKDDEMEVRKSALAALAVAKVDTDEVLVGLIKVAANVKEDRAVRTAAVTLLGSYGPEARRAAPDLEIIRERESKRAASDRDKELVEKLAQALEAIQK